MLGLALGEILGLRRPYNRVRLGFMVNNNIIQRHAYIFNTVSGTEIRIHNIIQRHAYIFNTVSGNEMLYIYYRVVGISQ